jgi:excisionase family DNA binding protein
MAPGGVSAMLRDGPRIPAALGPTAMGAAADPAPDGGGDGTDLVTLGEAAEALGLSASTLRRWADRGEIGSVRTAGGHRRFPVAEVQRMMVEVRRETRAKLRDIALPTDPQTLVADVLAARWREITRASIRSLYEPSAGGFFSSVAAEEHVERWACDLEAACRTAHYEGLGEASRRLGRQARLAMASTAERTLFVERFGELTIRILRERSADHAALVAARRIFVAVRNAMLDDETPAWRAAPPAKTAA